MHNIIRAHIHIHLFENSVYEHTIIRASMSEPHIDHIETCKNLHVALFDIITSMSVDFTGYSDSFTVTDLLDLSSVGYCCGTINNKALGCQVLYFPHKPHEWSITITYSVCIYITYTHASVMHSIMLATTMVIKICLYSHTYLSTLCTTKLWTLKASFITYRLHTSSY